MPSHHWGCCCGLPDCCSIYDCVEICDNYEIVHTWEEYAYVGSQVLLLSRATYRYTTQGVRTEGPPDPFCETEYPQFYSWDEVLCEVVFEAFDYVSASQSACFENTSPTQWQTVQQVCAPLTGDCLTACALNVGCIGWPDPVSVKRPGAGFYRQYQTRKYEYQGVVEAGDCFDGLDPMYLSCDEGCGKCKRLKFKFYCPNFNQTGWPVIPGTYNFRQTPPCDPDVVDDPANYGLEPWELLSDCACNGKPLWKDGRLYTTWDSAHVGVWTGSRGTLDGVQVGLSYGICDVSNDGSRSDSFKLDYFWNCYRPALGENCPGNADGSYEEIAFQMPVDIRISWNTAVNCV